MFCHLRPVRRLCLEKAFPHWFLYSRAFSGAEAVNALRPFYFAVHPDFFGQHPRERRFRYAFPYIVCPLQASGKNGVTQSDVARIPLG
ncbi:T-cell activation inhibitor, mitochondrial-like [Pteropus vampyrus]|uniref:T-cell activation inhibitor, mitochondrial-like n=1 Tax=Pteropus vampyrus TaxID=132908 RepID=A0A6P6CBL4_PTEVA|nr:T-cell activation inhibitor, mitochondrial-like [Pteropus vampyrus]